MFKALLPGHILEEAAKGPGWYNRVRDKHLHGYGIKHPETLEYMNAEKALAWAIAEHANSEQKEAIGLMALRELGRVLGADVRSLFTEGGFLKCPDELSDDQAAAIASIEVVTKHLGRGEDREVEYVHKIKQVDKMAAIRTALQVSGKLTEKHEVTGKDGGPIETTDVTDQDLAFNILRVLKKAADAPQPSEQGESA